MPEPQLKPEMKAAPVSRWYELEYLVRYRDAVLALGFFLLVAGVFLIPKVGLQAGLIVSGAGLMYAAWRILIKA
jgi:hypothetical protein